MAKVFDYDNVPTVRVTGGQIKGYFYDGVHIFKGVPYAQAKRFQMPEPVTPWDGVKRTAAYGYIAPLAGDIYLDDEIKVPHRHWVQSENCQNLNIWSKTLDPNAKRPVLVWLHGGGYITGSSIEQTAYDGSNMCAYGDVVVVSINHRLNVLGYLDLSAFGEKYKNSGNAGHMDIIAALRWIRDNISSFGGDPDNVTLFGQSGGGLKILDLMQMPPADGLFHKAIVMSGVNEDTILPICYKDSREFVEALLRELDLTADQAEQLEAVQFPELAEAFQKVSPRFYMKNEFFAWGPVKNKHYYGVPSLYGFRENAFDIPLMIGTTICEFDAVTTADDRRLTEPERIVERVSAQYGDRAQEVIDAFQEAYPGKNPINVLGIDRSIRPFAVKLAKMHAAGGKAKTYIYNFALDFPVENHKPAWHCADIPFVFHNTDKVEVCNIPGVSDELEESVFQAVIAFAKTGDPNHPRIPFWPPVSEEQVPTMVFDQQCQVRKDYDDRLYRVIHEVMPKMTFAQMMMQSMPSG